jgi:hypothetical protein
VVLGPLKKKEKKRSRWLYFIYAFQYESLMAWSIKYTGSCLQYYLYIFIFKGEKKKKKNKRISCFPLSVIFVNISVCACACACVYFVCFMYFISNLIATDIVSWIVDLICVHLPRWPLFQQNKGKIHYNNKMMMILSTYG